MKLRRVLLPFVLFTMASFTYSLAYVGPTPRKPQDEWDAAQAQIRRLHPSAFPQLPKNVSENLQARGCTIPQTYASAKPHNVIRGQFIRRGQTDWAVLCSRNAVSSILIFWRGSDKRVSEIEKLPDKNRLQTIGNGQIGYSRAIHTVGKKYIMDHYNAYKASGAPEPPPIDHEGVDDGFLEKASDVHYYYRGKWLKLKGGD
jgi:hypothetical protein